MKIAIIGSKGIPAKSGGIERHVEELAIRLVKRGFDVSVYGRPWYLGKVGGQTFKTKGVATILLPSIRTKNLDAISHTFKATMHAIREGFDVFHYHGVGPSLLAWIPRLFAPKARVLVTFHCIDRNHQKWGLFARLMLKLGEWTACNFAHKTIVVSKTLAHYVREVYGCDAAYVPNGITPPGKGADLSVLKKLGLVRGGYVVMVSRLVRHKGAHTLIEAWKKLKDGTDDYRVRNLKLAIVGDGAFTDAYVKELHASAKGRKDIVLAGFRSGKELETLIGSAAFAVHPSVSEGLPIAVLEEMSYGKAVLATDIPEHLEIIEGKGYTFRAGRVRDLMLQMHYLATHPRERAKKGAEAKKFVTTYYRWDDIAKDTADVYSAVVRPSAAEKAALQPVRRIAS